MAEVGTFGSVAFKVSSNHVKTFNNLSYGASASYATHDRHIQKDILEFLGSEPRTIDFDMQLSAFLGVNPVKEIENLIDMCESGVAERLVIGGTVYGYKWVITSVKSNLTHFDGSGRCLRATAKVSLKEYPKR